MTEPDKMYDFFISYNKADKAWAEWIAWQLEEEGYSTIIQAWDMGPGSHFPLKMNDATIQARRTIAVLSPDYLTAKYTQPEWEVAFQQDPTGTARKLLPIRVRECTLQGILASIVYIDLVGLRESAAQDALLKGILEARLKPSHAPGFPPTLTHSPSLANSFPGDWPEIRNVPYRRNHFFTGREAYLEHLVQQLNTTPTVSVSQTHAISGLGGIGKTQTALEYLYCYEKKYRYILWITAASEETLTADFEKLVMLLGIAREAAHEQQMTQEKVKSWFQQHQNWLLIFDNADNPEILSPYLPENSTNNGHILLTTRIRNLGSLAHSLPIDKMELNEGVLFLLRRAGILTPQQELTEEMKQEYLDAESIVKKMDGLPLAIDQAGAYINENNISLAKYGELYQKHYKQLLTERGDFPPGHPETVATTWSISFEKIKSINPDTLELLYLCAFLAPDAIPLEMLIKGSVYFNKKLQTLLTNELKLNDALKLLQRYSFLQRNPKTDTLSLHRLVQVILQSQMSERTCQSWAKAVIKTVNDMFSDPEFSNWPECDKYLPHAEICKEFIDQYTFASQEAADLLHKLGMYWQGHAQYRQALSLYQQALAIKKMSYGPDHPVTVNTLNEIARLYHTIADYAQALSLYQQALAITKTSHGLEHPSTVHEIARLYHTMGDYTQALPLYQQALTIYTTSYGPEHPSTATTLHQLASLYHAMGDYAQALSLYQQALTIYTASYRLEHPSTASTLHNLASLYHAMGDYAQALSLYQQAFTIKNNCYGPDHPSTATTLHRLAWLYQNMGDFPQALPLYQQALTIYENKLGLQHRETITTIENFASLYKAIGNDEQAEMLLKKLEIQEDQGEDSSGN